MQQQPFAGTIVQTLLALACAAGLLLAILAAAYAIVRARGRDRGTVLRCQCGYDLRGTIKARHTTCPECGRNFSA